MAGEMTLSFLMVKTHQNECSGSPGSLTSLHRSKDSLADFLESELKASLERRGLKTL